MNKLTNFGKGYRTYLGVAILFVLGGLKATGFIDENTFQTGVVLGGAITVYGLRKAI